VFHVSVWGDWGFVLGAKPTKAPRGDGTGSGFISTALAETDMMAKKLYAFLFFREYCAFDFETFLL